MCGTGLGPARGAAPQVDVDRAEEAAIVVGENPTDDKLKAAKQAVEKA